MQQPSDSDAAGRSKISEHDREGAASQNYVQTVCIWTAMWSGWLEMAIAALQQHLQCAA